MEIYIEWTRVHMTDLKILAKAYVFLQINSNNDNNNKNSNLVLTLDPTDWREGKRFIFILSWPKSININIITSNVRILTRPLCRTWWQGALDLYEADRENVCNCSLVFDLYHRDRVNHWLDRCERPFNMLNILRNS